MRRLATVALSLVAVVRGSAADDSFEDQVQAYLRLFPRQTTYNYMLRFTGGDPQNLNTWLPKGEPALVRAGNDVLPRTNNDTYYKAAVLSLENGPVVLEANAPTMNRFNSFQLDDDRNVNYRNIVFPAGKYTLYFGARPKEIEGQPIEVPAAFSLVFVRIEVRDKNDIEDVAAAKIVYDGIKIRGGSRPREFPQRLDLLSAFSADVVAEANRRMDEVFATVPFGETVVGPGKQPGRDVPYLYHAASSKSGWGGPDPSHSAYEAILFDRDGHAMKGSNGTYSVTTTIPPVDAFWSVTVYETESGGRLHPNRDDRYHYNGTTASKNGDGTVTFTFKARCETADKNCLEVPLDRFDVTVRYFLPRQEILSGAWRFPKVSLLEE